RLDCGLGVPSPFFSVWDWRPGVPMHMFWVLTVLLSRALRGGPTRRLVLGCGLEDVDQHVDYCPGIILAHDTG
ncbi:hypothetical protein EDB84DRAFT_1531608, partial [Lactarius hengduanensis]